MPATQENSEEVISALTTEETAQAEAQEQAQETAAEPRSYDFRRPQHLSADQMKEMRRLHVAAAVSRAPFVEYPFDPPGWTIERRDFILPDPIQANDGYAELPEEPGLGVKIDWQRLEKLEI